MPEKKPSPEVQDIAEKIRRLPTEEKLKLAAALLGSGRRDTATYVARMALEELEVEDLKKRGVLR